MKFLDKVKNMFTEEVEEEPKEKSEVKIEQIVPEKTREFRSSEDYIDTKVADINLEDRKPEKKPVFFTDDDFNDLDNYFKKAEPKRENIDTYKTEKFDLKEKYRDYEENRKREEVKTFESNNKDYDPLKSATDYLEKYNKENVKDNEPYQGNTKIEKQEPKFKPTPIISPVYGILDKNYHKEDIVNKNDKDYKSVDGLSVDSIRQKAYGTLEDELENTLFGSNSILFKDENKTKNKKVDSDFFDEIENEATPSNNDESLRDLENITMDIGKELDSLLNKDETNDSSNNNNSNFDDDDDLFNLIDTMYDGDDAYDA